MAKFSLLNGQSFTEINTGLTNLFNSSVAFGDYDNDQDLDVLMIGFTGSDRIAIVYRNDGNGAFLPIDAELTGVVEGSTAWADYDNDGDLDIFISGFDGVNVISKIYQNNDQGSFAEIDAELMGISFSAIAWRDYDNDGDLDLLVTGLAGNPSEPTSKIYLNEGKSKFSEVEVLLTGVYGGSVAWGDYDNDSDADLLLTGATGNHPDFNPISLIYRNENGTFVQSDAALIGLYNSAAAWGDYDSDGDLDILLIGEGETIGTYLSKVYRNDNGNFVDIDAALLGVGGSALWGDYDNDGDLDIVMTGFFNGGDTISKVYKNDSQGVFSDINAPLVGVDKKVEWGDYDNDDDLDILLTGDNFMTPTTRLYRNDIGVKNTPPGQPTELTSVVLRDTVTLRWSSAMDNETPTAALTYNVRIGRTPNGDQIISANADSVDGFRRIPVLGNAQMNTDWRVHGLNGGKYFWSVQAIDNAFSGSKFATPESFTIQPKPPMLRSPENQSTGATRTPILTWQKSIGADSYRLQVSTSDDFITSIFDLIVTDTSFATKPLEHFTVYYWHVNATNIAGTSDWSATWRFKTLLQPPRLLSPTDKAIVNGNIIDLSWTSVINSSGYHLQVANDSSFQKLNIDQVAIADTFFTFEPISDSTDYYWHARAVHEEGFGEWSSTQTFRTDFLVLGKGKPGFNGIQAVSELSQSI